VFVQSGRGEDHMQNSANRMVDRHLNFSRMPATTEGEDERPADFRRQDTNQCAAVIISQSQKLLGGGVEAVDLPTYIDRDDRGVQGFKKAVGVLKHLNPLAIEQSVF